MSSKCLRIRLQRMVFKVVSDEFFLDTLVSDKNDVKTFISPVLVTLILE